MHPDDARALAAITRAARKAVERLERDWVRWSTFTNGRPLRVPVVSGDDAGQWLELRLVTAETVVEEALEKL